MGIFASVNKHSQTGGGNWWKAGKYRARLTKVEFKRGHKGESFIIEAEVLKSSNSEIQIGETRSQVIKMDKESAMGNVASFMRVCQAIVTGDSLNDPEKLTVEESDVEAACGEDQPLVGLEVDIEAIDITTKAGNPFTKIIYHVPAEMLAS